MDNNNNNNKRSPLDEIMRITNEARRSSQSSPHSQQIPAQQPQQSPVQQPQQRPVQQPQQRPVQQPQQRPVQQPQQRPVQQPQQRPVQQPQQRPVQQPQASAMTTEYRITPPNNAVPATNSSQSRADKVRMARENALRARENINASHTRVVDMSNLTPDQKQAMENELEEARRLVRENAQNRPNTADTRVADTVSESSEKKQKKNKKQASEMEEAFEETVSKGVLSGTVKAVIYIVSVLVVSGCLALFTILVGNDCFAFVKSDSEITVEIPEDADLGDIARELKKAGVIDYPNMFKLYIKIRGKTAQEYYPYTPYISDGYRWKDTDAGKYNKFIKEYKNYLEAAESNDRKLETWYQENDPSLSWASDEDKALHVGDMWCSNGVKSIYTMDHTWMNDNTLPDILFDKSDTISFIHTAASAAHAENDLLIPTKYDNEYLKGTIKVNSNMGYDTLIAQFKPHTTRNEITVTIVEGSTTQQIIDLFVSKGIGTPEGFKNAIETYTGDFWFLKELTPEMTKDRIYRLDGYLFPDTYNFYTDATEEDVLFKLLSNFEAKFDIENKERAKELGMTVDDIVIMASMIQKEAMYNTDYPLVSSVFHNRIKNPSSTNGLLQSNATVQYTMPPEEVELKLTYAQIDKYDNGYNTFKYPGLPAGPICNSSLNALNWALYPADTDYYYFVSDMEGFNHYAATWAEHDKNVQTYQGE